MLAAHQLLGATLVVVAFLAGILAAIAYRRGREPGVAVRQLLALVQTLLVGQVGLGLLLLTGDRRADDELHYLYGTLALAAVLAPWLYAPRDPRTRLLWFAGATLLAGALAVRAYLTGS